jgi:SAM-dependent methyltransferase
MIRRTDVPAVTPVHVLSRSQLSHPVQVGRRRRAGRRSREPHPSGRPRARTWDLGPAVAERQQVRHYRALMQSVGRFSLDEFYDAYPQIEPSFQASLDKSLLPRGPELLYDLVGALGLPSSASVVDAGCGEGRHAIALAERFGFAVQGIDPVARHINLGTRALAAAVKGRPTLAERVRFKVGTVEALPVGDGTVDLVWCRDVLGHVRALDRAYGEFRRVLRDEGRVIVYQTFGTDRLEPREAEWLWTTMGVIAESADAPTAEAAIVAAGFRIDECVELRSEWGEWLEEQSGHGRRRLLHAARLLRSPERYVAEFGQASYDIMLGDCLWHVYGMLGKLSGRVYLLSRSQ